MQERRKHKRLAKNETAFFDTETSSRHQATILDISLGGMRIGLDKHMAVGTILAGQFKILPQAGAFHIRGQVSWVRPAAADASNTFEIGIKFTKISAAPL
ncbi:MAG TPA: PilZ domain-containing protein [Candidatus Omnitrophota bacterium]|nr:PilZ domain-containing protein [Candidatus Omnitrophota bacterium]